MISLIYESLISHDKFFSKQMHSVDLWVSKFFLFVRCYLQNVRLAKRVLMFRFHSGE